MKLKNTLTICILSLGFVTFGVAQEKPQNENPAKKTETAEEGSAAMAKNGILMRDDKLIQIKNGETIPVNDTMEMKNGTKVMADGTVMMKNGETMKLENGDKVTMKGKVIKVKSKKEKN